MAITISGYLNIYANLDRNKKSWVIPFNYQQSNDEIKDYPLYDQLFQSLKEDGEM